MQATGRTRVPWEFLLAAGAVYGAGLWIVAALETCDRPELVAAGLTVDLTLLVPLLYWFTCVRRRGWPRITVAPVFVAAVLIASWMLPAAHRGTVELLEYALAPLELGLLGLIGWRAWRGWRAFGERRRAPADEMDAVDALREAARELVGSPALARVVSYELAILYLALAGWRLEPRRDRRCFTCYRDASYGVLFAALMIVAAIELVAVHLALHVWVGPVAAWVVSALSLYGVLWLLGDYQALRLRPTVVTGDGIRLRLGLRWETELPFRAVRSVERAGEEPRREDLKMAVLGAPNVRLRLLESVSVYGFYGVRRTTRSILLAVDSPDRFVELVRARLDADGAVGADG
jgi:hypothetical protein